MPSSTTSPIASAQVDWRAIELATNALRPRPVASASGKLANAAHERSSARRRPAPCRPRWPGCRCPARCRRPGRRRSSRARSQDDRVQHDDVGHRQEGHDAAADLPADGRAALADLEEAVEAGALRSRSRCLASCRSQDRSLAEPGTPVLHHRCGACSVSAWTWVTSSRRSTRSATAPTSWRRSSRSTSTASAPPRSARRCGCSASSACCPFWGALQDSGRTWWLWTCLAGFGLGLCGLEYCRRRRKERAAAAGGPMSPRHADPLGARRRRQPRLRRALRRPASREGADVAGEARLADALVPARRPDPRHRLRHGPGRGRAAGSGPRRRRDRARPGAARRSRGRRTPTSRSCPTRRSPSTRPSSGAFDLVVVVGNVMIFLGEGTERGVLAAGARPARPERARPRRASTCTAIKAGSRTYPADEFVADVDGRGPAGGAPVRQLRAARARRRLRRVGARPLSLSRTLRLRASRTRRRSGCRRRGPASAAAAACARA